MKPGKGGYPRTFRFARRQAQGGTVAAAAAAVFGVHTVCIIVPVFHFWGRPSRRQNSAATTPSVEDLLEAPAALDAPSEQAEGVLNRRLEPALYSRQPGLVVPASPDFFRLARGGRAAAQERQPVSTRNQAILYPEANHLGTTDRCDRRNIGIRSRTCRKRARSCNNKLLASSRSQANFPAPAAAVTCFPCVCGSCATKQHHGRTPKHEPNLNGQVR